MPGYDGTGPRGLVIGRKQGGAGRGAGRRQGNCRFGQGAASLDASGSAQLVDLQVKFAQLKEQLDRLNDQA